jgi:DUF4097 and DUF4098 domain-containing protein YvlB
MRRLFLIPLAFLLAASAAGAQEILGRRDRVYTLSERVSGGRIGVFSSLGSITVTESSGSTVEYRAEKEERRGDVEDIGFVVLRRDGGLTICAVYDEGDECEERGLRRDRGFRGRWGDRALVNITVSVPRGTIVAAASGNGAVSLAAAVREARVSSGNGRVNVSRVTGRVDASTGNGQVNVEGVGGPVAVSSGNGDLTVTATSGPVDANTGNGDIYVTMDRLTGREDMQFTSGNGRIEIVAPADFSAEVEASTGNGRVSTEFPITLSGRITATRLRGTIGDGGRRLRLTTGSGAIDIRKRA